MTDVCSAVTMKVLEGLKAIEPGAMVPAAELGLPVQPLRRPAPFDVLHPSERQLVEMGQPFASVRVRSLRTHG
jgi:hypothetical protein